MTAASTVLLRIWGIAVAIVLGAGAADASAFEASVSMNPATITYYGPADARTTTKIEYRLRVTAGPQDERVLVEEGVGSGSVVDGPATLQLVFTSVGHGDSFGTPGRDGCGAYASPLSYFGYELALPAGSSSSIAFTADLHLVNAPTSASGFTASFRLAPTPPASPTGKLGLVPGEVTVSSPLPKLAGTKPSALSLRAGLTGSGLAAGARRLLAVKPRSAMRVSGLLAPARRGDWVTIWDYAPGAMTPVRLATVRVDRHGKYQYLQWRPTILGLWELYATWPGRDGLVEKARSGCGGPQIKVTNDVGYGKPRAPSQQDQLAQARAVDGRIGSPTDLPQSRNW